MSAPCPVFGFVVRMQLVPGARAAPLMDALVKTVMEPRGLQCRGGGSRVPEVVVSGEGLQATDGDRQAAIAWLERRPDVSSFNVGPLVDVGSAA